MKTFSSICLIVSLFVLPCILNLENGWCCLTIVVCAVVSFLLFKRHNPGYITK